MSDVDAKQVEAIAEMARRLGMSVSVLIVGDVRLVLSSPWPAKSELPAQVQDVQKDRGADPKLEKLRQDRQARIRSRPA